MKRGRRVVVYTLLFLCIFCFVLFRSKYVLERKKYSALQATLNEAKRQEFRSVLSDTCDEDKTIILSVVDSTYTDMAFNFHELSIEAHGITNILYITLSQKTRDALSAKGLKSFTYLDEDFTEDVDAEFGSQLFNFRCNIRTAFILDALRWGYNVLLTDLDIIFFTNPLPHLTCTSCDMEFLLDDAEGLRNAGFMFMRPTSITVEIVKRVKQELVNGMNKVADQEVFNNIIKKYGNRARIGDLDRQKFPCGEVYFEHGNRHFVGEMQPCAECVLTHNNWIVGKEAKIYRFKETGLWTNDEDGYYSNADKYKYLVYNNPVVFSTTPVGASSLWNLFSWGNQNPNGNYEKEIHALKSAIAIGRILNRIVILPKFHDAHGKNVSLIQHLLLRNFDKHFSGKYREHSFLKHPKLSSVIREEAEKVNEVFLISSDVNQQLKTQMAGVENTVEIRIANPSIGATSQEIKDNFNKFTHLSILRFHNLYGAFSHFNDKNESEEFEKLVTEGIICTSDPRQYTRC